MISSENDRSRLPKLTEIEKRCLKLAAAGRTPAEIAHETDLTVARATEVLHNAVDRLGARNLTGAIARAVRLNLV